MTNHSSSDWLINSRYRPFLLSGRIYITILIILVIIFGLIFGQIVLGSLIQNMEYTLVIILGSLAVYIFGLFWSDRLYGALIPRKVGFSSDSLYLGYRKATNEIRWEDIIDIEVFPKGERVKNPAYIINTKDGKSYRLGRIGISIDKKLFDKIEKKIKSNVEKKHKAD